MPALIAVTAISAGASLGGAYMQSRAAGKAADKQEAAAEKGLALQRDMYRQSRADLAPYMSAGAGANATLAGLMGTGMAPVPDVQSSAPGGGMMLPDGRTRPEGSPTVGQAQRRPGFEAGGTSALPPRPGYQGDVWNPDTNTINNTGYNVPTRAAGERTAPDTSGYVLMRAPTGEEAHVAPQQVGLAMQRGAVRI